MTDPAVLFDIDGTLVDSNYLHVYAWQRAFADEDVPVAAWQLHRCIGMDGSMLVRTLSHDAPGNVQDQLSDAHSRYYRDLVPLLAPLPGAAVASPIFSAPQDLLDQLDSTRIAALASER